MAIFVAIQRGRNLFNRRVNNFKNPMDDLNDQEVIDRFRLDRPAIFSLADEISPFLVASLFENRAVPIIIQLLVTLRFLATGDMQRSIGDIFNISQGAVSSIIRSVTRAIVRVSRNYICMPAGEEAKAIEGIIFHDFQIPNVVGLIDGTHVRVQAPSLNEYAYVNRKNYHSINVQVITDCNHVIRDVVSK